MLKHYQFTSRFMEHEDDTRNLGDEARDMFAEGKKDIKNDWAQTKADVEKAKNNLESEVDKL